jgi:acetoin utilization deacetylase AcuC-like enzyme
MRAYYSDCFVIPLPPRHRFPLDKYKQVRAKAVSLGVLHPSELEQAPLVDRSALELVHTPEYLARLFSGALSEPEQRRLGFAWSEELLIRSRASVGGTLAAARWALARGIAGNLAGGTHHAFAEHGEGFCVFNDIAIAIRVLQSEGKIERAVVVDLDVHQGNGTAKIFEGDPAIFTFSIHGRHNYPFQKTRSSRDVALEDETGDDQYLRVLGQHLPEVLELAAADIVFYQAGVDPLGEDALGRLALTAEGLWRRDELVLREVARRDLPVVLTLGGGYAKPIDLSVDAHVGTYGAAREVFGASFIDESSHR